MVSRGLSCVELCKSSRLPFVYLGFYVDGDARRLIFWDPLISCIKARLFGWKSRYLSLVGRLVFLKCVISTFLIYFLSLLKAPSCIISSIKSILNVFFFFWDFRKIS